MFIDTHTHNTDEAFAADEIGLIERALAAGVGKMLQADIDSKGRDALFALCERHPGVLHPMLGLYPGSVEADWQNEIDELLRWKDRRDVVAIGEIGLDYHYSADTAAMQMEALKVQLELADKLDLPVNIHLREATEDFFKVLDSCRGLALRGNLHAFSGSHETFRRLQKYGDWYVGIGGVVTFKNAGIARELEEIPMEKIVLETDSPYLTPVPFRGKRNESAYIPIIAAKIAEIKGLSVQEVEIATTQNAYKLFPRIIGD